MWSTATSGSPRAKASPLARAESPTSSEPIRPGRAGDRDGARSSRPDAARRARDRPPAGSPAGASARRSPARRRRRARARPPGCATTEERISRPRAPRRPRFRRTTTRCRGRARLIGGASQGAPAAPGRSPRNSEGGVQLGVAHRGHEDQVEALVASQAPQLLERGSPAANSAPERAYPARDFPGSTRRSGISPCSGPSPPCARCCGGPACSSRAWSTCTIASCVAEGAHLLDHALAVGRRARRAPRAR
jgi:hypothetical protein